MGKKVVKRRTEEATAEKIPRTTTSEEDSSKEMIAGDGGVDDLYETKSWKKILSRCSPSYFIQVMSELKPILGERQKIRISGTPFAKWIDSPVPASVTSRIDHFLNRFDASSSSFVVSKDITIPFRSPEFSFILGLRHSGKPVDLKMKKDSIFLSTYFAGVTRNAHRRPIREKMLLLARSNDEKEIDDFVRCFILFIFNCIIFPTGGYGTPNFIFPYLDDLTTFFDHAWGDAAFRFLYQEICHLGSKFYVDGCLVGLMALVYETLPILGVCHSLNVYPRLFRWVQSKIPLNKSKAKSLFKSIDSTQVLSIQPFYDEEEEDKLLHPNRALKPKEETSDVRRLETIVMRQMDEINSLKNRCAELEARSARSGVNEKESMVAQRENVAEHVGELDKSQHKAKSELGDEEVSSCDDVDVVVHNVCDPDEDNNVLEGPPNENVPDDARDSGCSNESSCRSIAVSKVKEMSISQSTIGNNVGTVADRVKKRKGPMLVSSSSSTPKYRAEVKKQPFVIDLDQDGSTWTEENMNDFKGRVDFIGHKNASDKDIKLVMEFLANEELEAIVWEDKHMRLSGRELRVFLFHEPVVSDMIDVYMRIMQKQSLDNGSEIYCMDTNVQTNVLQYLERYGKNRTIPDMGYEAFFSGLQPSTRDKLMELNEDILRRCKYVVFPINDRWHWFLLVFDTREGIFKLWNSKHDARATGTARVYMKFLAACIPHLSGFDHQGVARQLCRQQEPTRVDCGVHTCLWLHCLAYDTTAIWEYEHSVNMDAYRVRIAATVLGRAFD